jgi:hypothetical protein
MSMKETRKQPHENRDPITGAPGAHPVGTGAGAAAGGMAGAGIGTAIGGPLGTVVGATVGAIAGGLAGKGVAEMIDPTVEEAYWRESYTKQPYYAKNRDYDFYAPAYRAGWEGRAKYHGKTFEQVEDELAADYKRYQGKDFYWDEVRPATRAAWERIDARVLAATGN